MKYLLDGDYINSLPQPFQAVFFGGGRGEVVSINAQTGVMQVHECGRMETRRIAEVNYFIDADGYRHYADSFYSESRMRGNHGVSKGMAQDELRQTGRTYRMLQKAFAAALSRERVIVISSSPQNDSNLFNLWQSSFSQGHFDEDIMSFTCPVAKEKLTRGLIKEVVGVMRLSILPKAPPNFDWGTLRRRGDLETRYFVDHAIPFLDDNFRAMLSVFECRHPCM